MSDPHNFLWAAEDTNTGLLLTARPQCECSFKFCALFSHKICQCVTVNFVILKVKEKLKGKKEKKKGIPEQELDHKLSRLKISSWWFFPYDIYFYVIFICLFIIFINIIVTIITLVSSWHRHRKSRRSSSIRLGKGNTLKWCSTRRRPAGQECWSLPAWRRPSSLWSNKTTQDFRLDSILKTQDDAV